nr:unnamed protein product [Digitaria exilis]
MAKEKEGSPLLAGAPAWPSNPSRHDLASSWVAVRGWIARKATGKRQNKRKSSPSSHTKRGARRRWARELEARVMPGYVECDWEETEERTDRMRSWCCATAPRGWPAIRLSGCCSSSPSLPPSRGNGRGLFSCDGVGDSGRRRLGTRIYQWGDGDCDGGPSSLVGPARLGLSLSDRWDRRFSYLAIRFPSGAAFPIVIPHTQGTQRGSHPRAQDSIAPPHHARHRRAAASGAARSPASTSYPAVRRLRWSGLVAVRHHVHLGEMRRWLLIGGGLARSPAAPWAASTTTAAGVPGRPPLIMATRASSPPPAAPASSALAVGALRVASPSMQPRAKGAAPALVVDTLRAATPSMPAQVKVAAPAPSPQLPQASSGPGLFRRITTSATPAASRGLPDALRWGPVPTAALNLHGHDLSFRVRPFTPDVAIGFASPSTPVRRFMYSPLRRYSSSRRVM